VASADQNEEAIGLERDRASGAVDPGDPETAKQGRRVPGVVQGADRAFLELGDYQHAPLSPHERTRPIALDRLHREAEGPQQVDPVDPAFQQRAASGERLIVAPATRPLGLERVDRQIADLSDVAGLDGSPQHRHQRLVGVVLRHQHLAPARQRRGFRHIHVGGAQECWFLHDHVLAGGQRLQREREVLCRRSGDHRGIHLLGGECGGIAPIGPDTSQAGAEIRCATLVSAREAELHVVERGQPAGVLRRNAAAPEENEMEAAIPAAAGCGRRRWSLSERGGHGISSVEECRPPGRPRSAGRWRRW
jgi:hypothetical protein